MELLPDEEEALFDIHGGLYHKTGDIHPKLFNITLQTLNNAVDKGFGIVKWGEPDWEFINELKNNNAVFAAFKNHHLQNDLVSLLHDWKGQAKPFYKFRKDSLGVIGQYNRHWLQTEHNTALKRARVARQFKEYERNKDLYANLRWVPSTAAHPREGHKPFYNQVWAYDDAFWAHHMPGSLWGCQCGIEPTDEKPTNTPWENTTVKPDPGLEGNPAKTARIFSDNHSFVVNTSKAGKKKIIRAAGLLNKEGYSLMYRSSKGGSIFRHPLHGASELSDNMKTAKKLADKGDSVWLLPNIDPQTKNNALKAIRNKMMPFRFMKNELKNPDAFILNHGFTCEFKTIYGNAKNTVKNDIRGAIGQANNIVLNVKSDITESEFFRQMKGQCLRSSSFESITVIWKRRVITISRGELEKLKALPLKK
jgi:hypothetical protein